MISNKQATLVIKIDELSLTQTAMINTSNVEHNFKMNVNSNSISLWWPAGYGERKLYNLTAEVTVDGQSITKSKMIGFRSIEIIEEPVSDDPSHGLSFYFRINNVDIFLKGSNWIPADSFQELIDERRFRDLLESAVQANMNVLRIWGGGLYEKEKFYDITNELGILIWHDFMFACSVIFFKFKYIYHKY
jgi:beta-mannosidase